MYDPRVLNEYPGLALEAGIVVNLVAKNSSVLIWKMKNIINKHWLNLCYEMILPWKIYTCLFEGYFDYKTSKQCKLILWTSTNNNELSVLST